MKVYLVTATKDGGDHSYEEVLGTFSSEKKAQKYADAWKLAEPWSEIWVCCKTVNQNDDPPPPYVPPPPKPEAELSVWERITQATCQKYMEHLCSEWATDWRSIKGLEDLFQNGTTYSESPSSPVDDTQQK